MKLGIVGAGPAGYLAALKGALLGIDVTLFEKDKIGGVCVNEGCIPVKSLVKIASSIENIEKLRKKGVSIEKMSLNWSELIKIPRSSSMRLQGGINLLLKKRNVRVINGKAEIVSDDTIIAGDKEYKFDNILIATGTVHKKPPFNAGEYWTSTDAIYANELPKSIGIIGGGVIGLEFAYIYRSLGAAVEVFEIMDEVLPNEDREFSSYLRKELEKIGVRFHLKTKVISVKKDEVIFDEGGENNIRFEKVMISIGREASLDGIPEFIEIEKGFIKVDEKLNTNIKKIYAAGDCIGGNLLAHTAYYEAEVAIDNILMKDKKYDESIVPRVIYTKPEYAACGFTEDALISKKINYRKEIFKFSGNGRAVAEEKTSGGVKILLDENGFLIGACILGESASELITILSLMMKEKIKPEDIIDLIFPHPTYSEGIKEAFLKYVGLPIHSVE